MKIERSHPQKLFESIGRPIFEQVMTSCGAGEIGFRKNYLPIIERLATTVQSLPLEKGMFDENSGAIRYALMSALTAIRMCDGLIFSPNATAKERVVIEPQFKLAAFIATIACVPLIVFHHLTVEIDGARWTPASKKPTLWDATEVSGSYDVSWQPERKNKPSSAIGIVFLNSFFPTGMFESFDPTVLLALCDAVNPSLVQTTSETPLGKVVRMSQERVRAAETQRRALFFEPHTSSLSSAEPAGDGKSTGLIRPVLSNQVDAPTTFGLIPSLHTQQTPEFVGNSEIPQQIVEWAKTVAVHLPDQITISEDSVTITKKALNFGIGANHMYAMILEAGLVLAKSESGFSGNASLAKLFKDLKR